MAAAKKDIHYYPSRKPLDEVGCADDATGCAGKEAIFPVKEFLFAHDPACYPDDEGIIPARAAGCAVFEGLFCGGLAVIPAGSLAFPRQLLFIPHLSSSIHDELLCNPETHT